jgi:hypothetical protein
VSDLVPKEPVPKGPNEWLANFSKFLDSFDEKTEQRYAILTRQKEVKPIADLHEWARWKEAYRDEWILRQEFLDGEEVEREDRGDAKPRKTWVSTVFLGLNHSFDDGKPLWFETMIFNGPLDGYQTRAETYKEALLQHEEALRKARAAEMSVFDSEEA